MIRFNLLLSLFLCFFIKVSAQRQNTYFIKNNGQYVTQRDSADYIRIVQEPEQGSELYPVREYYMDGTKKTIGMSSKIDPPSYEGYRRVYYPNGNKKEIANFSKGLMTDTAYRYYPSGNLYTISVYKSSPFPGPPDVHINEVRDSTGKELAVEGNGDYIIYDQDFGKIIERGAIKNGVPDGVWTGDKTKTSSQYTETYTNGKLISGESTDDQDVTYKYTSNMTMPKFKGGMDRFYSYLRGHVNYPENCRRAGITGVAIVKFTVEKDGTLTDVKVVNYVNDDLAKEAVRVMKRSPLWEPGLYRGKPARVAFNVPISFNISSH
ncbi:energy transducer TonB [Pedobacter cryoconitis]|uniref:TonB family protein n=1 Tax=Pedobacter cryoconitis TaxID=188932 RepID=A0A7X0J6F6_9SPHI|nr:energy transducer TonB [Pedobacter cryoconitis]MBB6500712.1 TonB family protein [Pedobacter cryoconitis]